MTRLVWLVRLLPLLASGAIPATGCSDSTGSCCTVCSEGKACGDTCINASQECHTSGGCACNG
jgi:hypothetical protein